ncbi:MAG: thiamine-binding protein [Clostridiales bacterium]|nr:thiamine-binding protein [Clostridiales bacterium]
MSQMDKMITCQLAYLPLEDNFIELTVQGVLDLIQKSNLKFAVGAMSTVVTGDKNSVMILVDQILEYAMDNSKFVLDIKISNTCGL